MTGIKEPPPGPHAARARPGNGQPAASLIVPAARYPRQPAQPPGPDLRQAGMQAAEQWE